MNKKPKLFIMIGLSASGKSTIAKGLSEDHNAVIVSSDCIRKEICGSVADQTKNEEVFKIFHKRIRKYLYEKRNVIADATNITMKSRMAIFNGIKGIDVEVIGYVVPKRIEDCIKDNVNRENPVPDYVIENQVRKYQIPFYEEGFDEIFIHNFDFTLQYKMRPLDMIIKMCGFDQKNPNHNMGLEQHCNFTYEYYTSGSSTSLSYDDGFLMGMRLHDIGKLFTQTFDENEIAHYYDHHSIGSYYVLSNLYNPNNKLEDKTKFLLDCCFLINYHMFPFSWNTDKAKQRWRSRFGEYKYEMLLKFHEADIARVGE